MDLETFAVEARAADAVVVLAVQGGLGQNGVLQSFFEMHGVPFTGTSTPEIRPVSPMYSRYAGLGRYH